MTIQYSLQQKLNSSAQRGADAIVIFTNGSMPLRNGAKALASLIPDTSLGKHLSDTGFSAGNRVDRINGQTYISVALPALTLKALRKATEDLVPQLQSLGCSTVAIIAEAMKGECPKQSIATVAGALQTGTYSYSLKTTAEVSVSFKARIITSCKVSADLKQACAQAAITGISENLQRKLVDMPPNILDTGELVLMAETAIDDAAKAAGNTDKLKLTTMSEHNGDLQRFGLFCAVSQASHQDGKVLVMEYNGAPNAQDKPTVFIGKGLVYDTGGVNVKSDGGRGMKADMGGAATVVAAMRSIVALNLPVNVVGIIGCASNDISSNAYRPDDVLKSYDGRTVEVINTDAEGRMVLADCIAFAADTLNPAKIVTFATLTGAKLVALGSEYAALLSNTQSLADKLLAASRKGEEKLWQLPMDEETFLPLLESKVADLTHVGGRYGGTITAGLFLAQFAKDVPFAHVDVAGTVGPDRPGYAQRTLVAFLQSSCPCGKTCA